MKHKFTLIFILVTLICQFAVTFPVSAQNAGIYFNDDGSTLILGNNDHYEIAFKKENGGILYILDKTTGQNVVNGSAFGCLWTVEFPTSSNPVIGGCDYTSGLGNNFIYKWDGDNSTLSFTYLPSVSSVRKLTATITIQAIDGPTLDMSIKISNYWTYPAEVVRFPFALTMTESGINQALMPVTPGILLNAGFFNQHRTILREHPGVFSDLLAVDSQAGKIAMYSVPGQNFAPVRLGLAAYPEDTSVIHYENPDWRHPTIARQVPDENTTLLVYDFPVLVSHKGEWESPVVRFTIGNTFNEVIRSLRLDLRIDETKPLVDKLGALSADLTKSPLFVVDPEQIGGLPFSQWAQVLPLIPKPATLLLVNYWQGGLYGSHPDIIPPDPDLGTDGDLKEVIKAAQEAGLHVMLMSMPAWWNADSATLQAISPDALKEATVQDKNGNAVESLMPSNAMEGQLNGYFVSPRAPLVQERLANLISSLTEMLGAELVYEEMLGSLPCPHDYNPAATGLNDCTGWVDHANTFKNVKLFTTGGSDLFVQNEIGFIGSAHSDKTSLDGELGQGNWTYYPLAPLLAHDKVLFYPYWTDSSASMEAMAWSFSMGYMLNFVLAEPQAGEQDGALFADSEWTGVLAVFQHQVGGIIAGQPMTEYKYITSDVTETIFEKMTITRNWNTQKSYSTDQYTLPPNGFMAQNSDGSLTAGVFTAYNGQDLPGSEHYLIEIRSDDSITIYQPLGDPADLMLIPLPSWDQSGVTATGYDNSGNAIASVPTDRSETGLKFPYKSEIDGKKISYFILTSGDTTIQSSTASSGEVSPTKKPGELSQGDQKPRKISENMALILVVTDGAMFLTFVITGIMMIAQSRRIRKVKREG